MTDNFTGCAYLLVGLPGELGEPCVVMLDDLLLLGELHLLLVAELQRVRVVEHGVDVLVGPRLHLATSDKYLCSISE
jgi:hypothetical protein